MKANDFLFLHLSLVILYLPLICSSVFFFNFYLLFIFIFGCDGSLLLRAGFLSW